MTLDKLNRRGGAAPPARPAATSADLRQRQHQQQHQQQRQEELKSQLLSQQPATSSVVAQSLREEMPKLLRRLALSLLFLAAAVALSLAFSLKTQSTASVSTESVEDAVRLLPASKTAAVAKLAAADHAPPSVHVLAKYPHDAQAFTQGLLVARRGDTKMFIESTGLYGKSTLREVAIETGEVLARYELPAELFGEGVTLTREGELVMLTWTSRRGFVFSAQEDADGARSFKREREFTFETSTGEGWGVDSDGSHLVVSDGSATLMFWDPRTLQEVRRVEVTFQGRAIAHLNELEVANGFVYANIWYQRVIAKIDPASGEIVAVFDCSALADPGTTGESDGAVLNGIAYDGDEDVFYLTGKLWNAVYKVRLVE